MKKLNLFEIKSALSRNEMKQIMAGSNRDGCAAWNPGQLCLWMGDGWKYIYYGGDYFCSHP